MHYFCSNIVVGYPFATSNHLSVVLDRVVGRSTASPASPARLTASSGFSQHQHHLLGVNLTPLLRPPLCTLLTTPYRRSRRSRPEHLQNHPETMAVPQKYPRATLRKAIKSHSQKRIARDVDALVYLNYVRFMQE